MAIILMTDLGDAHHLDAVTRERLHDTDVEIQWIRLFKIGWFFIGMVVGSALHDRVFHAIEQVLK